MAVLFFIFTLLLNSAYSPNSNARTDFRSCKELTEQGRFQLALEYFQRAIAENPDFVEAHLEMARVLSRTGQLKSAVGALQHVVKLQPDSLSAYRELAKIHEVLGNHDAALSAFQQVIRLDPDVPNSHRKLGELYFARSMEEFLLEADRADFRGGPLRRRLERILKSDSANPSLCYHLGLLSQDLGDKEGAIKHLRAAQSLDPAYQRRSSIHLVGLLEEQERWEEAGQEYDALMRTDGDDLELLWAAGRTKNRLKKFEDSEPLLQQGWSKRREPEVAWELARAEQGLGNNREAIPLLQAALEKTKQPEQIRFSLGMAYQAEKQYALALKEFETILDSYPEPKTVETEIRNTTRMRLAMVARDQLADRQTGQISEVEAVREGEVPEALVAIEKSGDAVLLVDKSSQTLHVYQKRNQRLARVETFACSTGQNDGNKKHRGDRKTPEGIYLFTEVKTGEELPDIYGKMAYPMDYPNPFDRIKGRAGSGIWLHSTDEPIRALLPQKTRGCVVVNDRDIDKLSPRLRLFDTPIIVYDQLEMVPTRQQEELQKEVEGFLSKWQKSWEAKNLREYIQLYSRSFVNGRMDLRGWRKYKRSIFSMTDRISLRLELHHVLRHKDYLVVTFRQRYQADHHQDDGMKRLFLVWEGRQLHILSEEWRGLES